MMSMSAQKEKLTVNFVAFPSVKFRIIWQASSKHFIEGRARFSGKSIRQDFSQRLET